MRNTLPVPDYFPLPTVQGPRLRRVSCLLVVIFVGLLPACRPANSSPNSHSGQLDIVYPLPEFRLTERSGASICNSDLHGKVWVASFVFTRCSGPCPQVTGTMARLQAELADQDDVRLVTFTVDPNHDNPQELTRYASRYQADPKRWIFLTGGEKELHRLMQEGFKVPILRNSQAQNPGEAFDHSTRLIVVDRQGQVRGYYAGIGDVVGGVSANELEESLTQLKAKITELLREPSVPENEK